MWNVRGIKKCIQRSLAGPRHRWEDAIKMDLQEVRCEGLDCIHVAQSREKVQVVVNTVMIFWLASNAGNLLTS